MKANAKAKFAQGIYKTDDVSKIPQTLIDFYDECAKTYYAITSNRDFNVSERGIIAAMEDQIHKRDLRIDELQERIAKLETLAGVGVEPPVVASTAPSPVLTVATTVVEQPVQGATKNNKPNTKTVGA